LRLDHLRLLSVLPVVSSLSQASNPVVRFADIRTRNIVFNSSAYSSQTFVIGIVSWPPRERGHRRSTHQPVFPLD
jgi:hypothetical protein